MNRIRIAALAGLLLLAAGCSAPPEEAEDGYQVYYPIWWPPCWTGRTPPA